MSTWRPHAVGQPISGRAALTWSEVMALRSRSAMRICSQRILYHVSYYSICPEAGLRTLLIRLVFLRYDQTCWLGWSIGISLCMLDCLGLNSLV